MSHVKERMLLKQQMNTSLWKYVQFFLYSMYVLNVYFIYTCYS